MMMKKPVTDAFNMNNGDNFMDGTTLNFEMTLGTK